MIIAIVQSQSWDIVDKFEALDVTDASTQFVAKHPEYECDSLVEFTNKFPELAQSLFTMVLH